MFVSLRAVTETGCHRRGVCRLCLLCENICELAAALLGDTGVDLRGVRHQCLAVCCSVAENYGDRTPGFSGCIRAFVYNQREVRLSTLIDDRLVLNNHIFACIHVYTHMQLQM